MLIFVVLFFLFILPMDVCDYDFAGEVNINI